MAGMVTELGFTRAEYDLFPEGSAAQAVGEQIIHLTQPFDVDICPVRLDPFGSGPA